MIITTPQIHLPSQEQHPNVQGESLSEVISGVVVKALSTDPKRHKKEKASEGPQPSCSPGTGVPVSPGRAVDLRMKNLQLTKISLTTLQQRTQRQYTS